MNIAKIEEWYKFSDPDANDQYVESSILDLLLMVGIYNFEGLDVNSQGTVNGEQFIIDINKFEYNGVNYYAQHIELSFENNKVTSKTGVPTELDAIFNDTSLELWYEYSSPDKKKEEDQRDEGFFDDDASGVYEVVYSNLYTWEEVLPHTDENGNQVTIIWSVVEEDVAGVWTKTETGSNGDVRTFAGGWNQATQENTIIESFKNSDSSLDYTRTEVSGNNGTTITYTGKTDHIGWHYLDGIYIIDPSNPIVETLDFGWNIISITGYATSVDETNSEAFGFNSNGQITVGGEAVYGDFGFDDMFNQFESMLSNGCLKLEKHKHGSGRIGTDQSGK